MLNKRNTLTLILITFFCWGTYAGHDEVFLSSISPLVKHLLNFSLIIAVAVAGNYGLKLYPEEWVLPLWRLLYLLIIFGLLLLGVVDIFFRINNFSFRSFLFGMRMLFTSPVPYGIIIMLVKRIHPSKNLPG